MAILFASDLVDVVSSLMFKILPYPAAAAAGKVTEVYHVRLTPIILS